MGHPLRFGLARGSHRTDLLSGPLRRVLALAWGKQHRQAVRAADRTLADAGAGLGLAPVVLPVQAVPFGAFQQDQRGLMLDIPPVLVDAQRAVVVAVDGEE